MELEELPPANLVGPQQDVGPIAAQADRNGVTSDTARLPWLATATRRASQSRAYLL